VSRIWQTLTQPLRPISDPFTLRQARLLSAILLIVFLGGGLVLLIQVIQQPHTINDADFIGTGVSVISVAGLYWLSRYGQVRFPAAALIGITLVLFVGVPFIPSSLDTLLYFATIPILLTAFFFSMRAVLGVAFIAVLLPFGLVQLSPEVKFVEVVNAVEFIGLSTAVFITFINHMQGLERIRSAQLQEAHRRVLASEAELEARVEQRTLELRRAKDEAENARQRAEDVNRIKSQFLVSMSHELRTPLNTILTFNELVAMGTFGPINEEQVDYLRKAVQSGQHLLSLINNVLDITKIQAGMMKLFVEADFDVANEMNALAAAAEKMLHGRPVTLVMTVEPGFPLLTCDKRRVRQVLLNLISNAVKYTEEGTITLCAQKQADEVWFSVSDTGPGIALEQQGIIFEPFVQTETGIKHAGSTGLGLPISKRLIEAHGGRLWVENQAGQGATFTFALPLEPKLALGEQGI
jgi:signal transduction histidine kinase